MEKYRDWVRFVILDRLYVILFLKIEILTHFFILEVWYGLWGDLYGLVLFHGFFLQLYIDFYIELYGFYCSHLHSNYPLTLSNESISLPLRLWDIHNFI